MINILYVSDCLKQRFGVTSVIMNYLRHFNFDEIKVDLLVYEDSEIEMIKQAELYGANVYFMPRLSIKNIKKFKDSLKSFFNTHSYDIVHSHFNQIDGMMFPLAKKSGTKICISHSHNTKLSDNRFKAIRNKLMCWNIEKKADFCAACSIAAGEALFGKNFNKSSKKLLIYNGIDCKRFAFNEKFREEIRTEFAIHKDTMLLGHIGSFKLQKNHKFLIKVFSKLLEKNDQYKLLLVGTGETQLEIQKEVSRLGISDKVIFAGRRSDANKFLSAFDAFILPSLYEGLPVVGVEAQTAGLECVFSDSITKEVSLTAPKFIGLEEPIEKWVATIKEFSFQRIAHADKIVAEKGYDIAEGAKKLQDFYCEIVKESNRQ